MKKLMFISSVIISAIFASSIFTYTIGSLIKAGWHSYHIAFIALCMLAILLVKNSICELKSELKK